MWETIVVAAIVVVVALLAARSLWRTLTGRDQGCACSGAAACPLAKPCDQQSPPAAKDGASSEAK